MSKQHELFHENLCDALHTCVSALGGPKRVGAELRPSSPDQAARWLTHCLQPDRPEKLDLDDLEWILKKARLAGCHAGFQYLAQKCGYSYQPIEPSDERDELMRQFIDRTGEIKRMLNRMEAIGIPSLKAVKGGKSGQ